jgi:hypothetical protein
MNSFLLAAGMALAACSVQCAPKKEAKMAAPQAQIPFAPFDSPRYAASGEIAPDGAVPQEFGTGPQFYWIRSEAGFARFGYAKADSGNAQASGKTQGPGDPDFAKQDVVYLTMGVQGTTGYDIRLESIRITSQEVRFQAKTRSPGPHDVVGEALTHPAQLIVVGKMPWDAHPVLVFDGKEVGFKLHVLE